MKRRFFTQAKSYFRPLAWALLIASVSLMTSCEDPLPGGDEEGEGTSTPTPTPSVQVSEVINWMDQRLKKEYYWMDEYNQKHGNFDLSLKWDEFLGKTLLSLRTNGDDGNVDYEGKRYLYSYVHRTPSTKALDATRASLPTVTGYGIEPSPYIVGASSIDGYEKGDYCFVIEHTYSGSPAANAGLRRGDVILKADGKKITDATYEDIWDRILAASQGSTTLSVRVFNDKTEKYEFKDVSLTTSSFEQNPIAFYDLLNVNEKYYAIGDKKIGYLSYLGFESELNDDLIEALSYLAARGVTDLILDLRLNGGGSVDTSTMLGSMLLSEDYVRKTYATLKRNPENKLFPQNELDTECLIVKNGIGEEFENTDLPNLNLPELWVITSSYTASASEMVIKGLEGLDVPVKLVGKTTNGKNCGMDVMEKVFGTYKYTYAPITFMNYNAKGDNDYSDGIKPGAPVVSGVSGVDFDKHYSPANPTKDDLSYECYAFPIPRANWAELNFTKSENGGYNFSGDFALYETVLRICGRTMLRSTASLSQVDIKFAEMATTRAMKAREVYDSGIVSTRRAYGATLTEAERLAIERAK